MNTNLLIAITVVLIIVLIVIYLKRSKQEDLPAIRQETKVTLPSEKSLKTKEKRETSGEEPPSSLAIG